MSIVGHMLILSKYLKHPGQTLAPVFVTALTKMTIYFLFFGPSAAPPLRHLKTVETGTQRMEVFQKAE
jgi:hypothetical protein